MTREEDLSPQQGILSPQITPLILSDSAPSSARITSPHWGGAVISQARVRMAPNCPRTGIGQLFQQPAESERERNDVVLEGMVGLGLRGGQLPSQFLCSPLYLRLVC